MSYSNERLIFRFVSIFVFDVLNVFALFAPLFNAVTKDKKGKRSSEHRARHPEAEAGLVDTPGTSRECCVILRRKTVAEALNVLKSFEHEPVQWACFIK